MTILLINKMSVMYYVQKTRVFHQKPSLAGLTGLNQVLMGFMGETGENSNSLCKFRIEEPNLENQQIILLKINN